MKKIIEKFNRAPAIYLIGLADEPFVIGFFSGNIIKSIHGFELSNPRILFYALCNG